jgi:hypothetical protein
MSNINRFAYHTLSVMLYDRQTTIAIGQIENL